MSRVLWGEFTEDENDTEEKQIVPTKCKQAKFDEIAAAGGGVVQQPPTENLDLKLRNSLVTQTIEVNKQTEMLQSLIETFTNKTEAVPMPAQIIPKVDFPQEISTDYTKDTKFATPFQFIPPQRTPFTRGIAKSYPELTPEICRAAMRKVISGSLLTSGFTCANDSALVLFTDAAEEYLRQFLRQIREVHNMNPQLELSNEIDVNTLERATQNYTGNSLLSLHNFYKRNIIERNLKEVSNFRLVFDDYNNLRKESEEMHVDEEAKEIANIIDEVPLDETTAQSLNAHSSSFMNILDELMKTPTDLDASLNADEPGTNPN